VVYTAYLVYVLDLSISRGSHPAEQYASFNLVGGWANQGAVCAGLPSPRMRMEAISLERLNLLHPTLIERGKQLDQILSARGVQFRITQGLRTWDEQAKLYAQGRTEPGQIVTNAPPGHSWHEYACAFDYVPLISGAPVWELSNSLWIEIRDAAESIGFASGSRWHHPDWPHLQITGRFSVSPDDSVRKLYADGGIKAVWDALA